MNNRYRFRAFDKQNKEMVFFNKDGIDVYSLHFHDDGWHISFDNSEDPVKIYDSEDFILMQSTGLTDKNGVEIWEGDIVEFGPLWGLNPNKRRHKGVVVWGKSGGWAIAMNDEHEKRGQIGYIVDNINITRLVIGNKFEHPELLGGGE